MRDLRIVFMGTPEFAVQSLRAIIESGFQVVGVVTAPDKPAGRGRKLQHSAVKKYAEEQNLPLLQPVNLKDPVFIDQLKQWKANLQVVVAFRMLPKIVWQLPEFGTFNLHASLLPQYRGAAPINWAIINGETRTGVSTFFIDEKIDTGEMILQEEVAIEPEESAGGLHDRLMEIGARLVVKTLEQIKTGKVTTTPQPVDGSINSAYKLNRDNTRIDWTKSLDEIHNHIRGLSPYPTAWTELQNNSEPVIMKIYLARKEMAAHRLDPGQIIQQGRTVKVAAVGGFIHLEEIQLPGKRKMKIKEFLNGFEFEKEAVVA